MAAEALARIPAIDPLPQLLAALARVESWGSPLPPATVTVKALRTSKPKPVDPNAPAPPPPSPTVLAHPTGKLEVRQKVAPMNVDLECFGSAPITGHNRFRLLSPETQPVLEVKAIDDFFASAQFQDMSDKEKLHRSSFAEMESGVSVGNDQVAAQGASVKHVLQYECILLGADGTSTAGQKATLPWERGKRLVRGGAARRNNYYATGLRRFERIGIKPRLST